MHVIKVIDVKKGFKVYFDKGATLKEKVLFQNRNHYEVHEVLKGIELTIYKGEVVGLIGENGCGKSTLLKLMTRIIYPDQGSIEVNGKVSSLLELGAGFHPDMSGRENIYTNASIFGLSKKHIDERIESIIEFSELGEFIDNPVRTYSSGMYMRLAFSVAINVDAEILLVDEILAVGDAAFQSKCFNKMQEIKRKGTTIVIVSHDLGSIEKLCDRAVWIKAGLKEREDRPHNVICEYLDYIMNKDTKCISRSEKKEVPKAKEILKENEVKVIPNKRWGNNQITIEKISLISNKEIVDTIKTEEDIEISIDFIKNIDVKDFSIGIAVNRVDGILIYGTNTKIDKSYIRGYTPMQGNITVKLPKFNILPGEYYLDIAIESMESKPYDYYCEALKFKVYSPIGDGGIVRLAHEWRLNNIELENNEKI